MGEVYQGVYLSSGFTQVCFQGLQDLDNGRS